MKHMSRISLHYFLSACLLACSFFLVSCDVGLNEDSNEETRFEKGQEALSAYNKIKGTYTGTLTRSDEASGAKIVDIEIRLFPIERVSDNRDEDGRRIVVTDLYGQYREVKSVDISLDYAPFIAEYSERTGLFKMQFGGSEKNLVQASISGILRNQRIEQATLTTNYGVEGTIETNRYEPTTSAPGQDKRQELRNRLERIYGKILGTYRGTLTRISGEKAPYKIQLYLTDSVFLENAGIYSATLKAMVIPDRNIDPVLALHPSASYNPNTGRIVLQGYPMAGRLNGFGTFSGLGYIEDGELILTRMTDNRGPMGTFQGNRQ